MDISKIRRYVLLAIMLLFFLQFFKFKALVGSLSGSLAVWSITLIDIFAYFETLLATKELTQSGLFSVIPLLLIYFVFGRSFCGWVCPMDYLFELINRLTKWRRMKFNIPHKIGYMVAFLFLLASFLIEIPIFSNYLSHLTNFFRMLSSGIFLSISYPVDKSVFYFSGGLILLLLGSEYFFPRLWCKKLCPLGKTYGLFNKISLLKLRIEEKRCLHCGACEQVCYMDVSIASSNKPILRDTNCIFCGRCLKGCGEKIIKMKLR